MRVLMVVSNDVVHDARVMKEARSLIGAGHTVSVIGWDRSGTLPEARVSNGIPIRYVRTTAGLRLLRHDAARNPFWWRRASGLGVRERPDFVHCHDLDTLPIGVRVKQRTGARLVYDCHEVFGYMIEEDVPELVTGYAFRMERQLAPKADAVVAANPAIKAYIDQVAKQPAFVVQNCEELTLAEYQPPSEGTFTIVYIGTLHRSRFVLEAIEAARKEPTIRLILGGSKALTETVRERCARQPNTQFLGLVPHEQVMPLTIRAHAVLSLFDPSKRINQVGFPNKIYEAMAAGRPSIVTRGLPMGDFVERLGCGLPVAYSIDGFLGAVSDLRSDSGRAERLGRAGLEAAKREYNWEKESRKLIALYEGLAG